MNKFYFKNSEMPEKAGNSHLRFCIKGIASLLLSFLFVSAFSVKTHAQASCGATVPSYFINFVGTPDSVWTSPSLIRQGNCCGTTSPDRCLRFEFVIDSNVAAVKFDITVGAIPPGALFYQLDCGPQQDIRTLGCISTPGFHALTFCKSGNNANTYTLSAIPKPLFPAADTVRVGCSRTLEVLGLEDTTLTWNSVFPGVPGQYNSYLSCTSDCNDPVFTPQAGAPAYIDYLVCGHPIADVCGFVDVCDTVRVYTYSSLDVTVSPNPAAYCPTSSGVTLTANTSGGFGTYSYEWKNNLGVVVGTGASYFASAGNYTVEVSDGLVPKCPKTIIPRTVTVSNIVPSTSQTNVSCFGGSDGVAIVSATGGSLPYTYSWAPGGSTNDTATGLTAQAYTVTVTDAGGCFQTANVTITQPADIVITTDSSFNVACNGQNTGAIYVSVSGGSAPFTYLWSNGDITQDITNLLAGSYELVVTDSKGCKDSVTVIITQPGAIVPLPGGTISPTNLSCFNSCDGSVTANPTGGTLPYSYLWTPGGATTQTVNGLCAGAISVVVTDANGCTIAGSTTLTQPDSLYGFIQGVSSYFGGYNVSCYNAADGTVDLEVTGGTAPFTYSWAPGAYSTQDLTNVVADTFAVTITDNNGCIANNTVILTQPDSLLVGVTSPLTPNGTNIGCKGESSGVIYSNVIGGAPSYSYSWSNGVINDTNNQVPAGFYTLTVTDQNGCVNTDTITLTEPDTLFALISSATVIGGSNIGCNGDSTGSASVVVVGGTVPYSYLWSNGETTVSIDSLYAGVIWVIVKDLNFCSASDTLVLTEPNPYNIVTSTTAFPGGWNVTCNGASDGKAIVAVAGGTPPFNYSWAPSGSTNDTATGLSAGWHYVTVSDANGCTTVDSVLLTEPDTLIGPLSLSVFPSGSNVSCAGSSDGAITLTLNGGTAPFTFLWSNGATTQNISNLDTGVYSVTITDTNGCVASGSATLVQPANPIVSDSIYSPTYLGGWNVSCNGGTDGSIFSVITGGSPPYTYSWSNGDTTANTFNVSVSTYYDTVRDVNGCMVIDSITLTEPPLVVSTASAVANINCFGESTGSIGLSTVGGTPPYRYTIDSVSYQSDSVFANLPIGTYIVTVLDTNGCSDTLTVTLTQPPSAFTASVASTNILCFGDSTGDITITANGGVSPYTYSIDSGSTYVGTALFSNLPFGTYDVIAKDSNGCTNYFNVVLTQPTAPLTASIINSVNILCNGNLTGSFDVSVSGGTAPYEYSIDSGSTYVSTNAFTGLGANNYQITVRDTNGCITTATITLTEPPLLVMSVSSTVDINCFGDATGSIDLSATGGVTPYQFSLDTALGYQSDSVFNNLIAGTYLATVQDANGCFDTTTVVLAEPASPFTASVASTDILCFGDSTGDITITANGGVLPYIYSIDTTLGFVNTPLFDSLPAGTYDVVARDSNGCSVYFTVILNEPLAPLSASIANQVDVLCNGNLTGSFDIPTSGGTAPYQYSIDTGSTFVSSNAFVGLGAGSYSIIIRDTNGCSLIVTTTITEPTPLVTDSISSLPTSCGVDNGTAAIFVSGGVPAYSYSWSAPSSSTSDTAQGLAAQQYVVTVTDANGCVLIDSVMVNNLANLSASITLDDANDCFGDTMAIVTMVPSGGTAPFSYLWTTPNADTTSTVDSLVAGSYSCTVTDSSGCTFTASVTITDPPLLVASISSSTDVSCFGGNNGDAIVSVVGGTGSYLYQWSSSPTDTNSTVSGLVAGSYSVTVTDSLGCVSTANVAIAEPPVLDDTTFVVNNVSCFADSNGVAVVVASGGTAPYSYIWNTIPVQSADTATLLRAGTYTVTLTDALGCTVIDSATITEPLVLSLAMATTDVSCFGGSNGSSVVTVTGGTIPYAYSWNTVPPQITDTATGLIAGTYTVTIIDSLGCTDSLTAIINEPTVVVATIASQTDVSCFGGNNGTATAAGSGGILPYTYSWNTSPVQTSIIATGLIDSTYIVTVTDSNGCSDTASVTIIENNQLQVTATPVNVSCNRGQDGSISVVVAGGVQPYSYSWSPNTADTTALVSNLDTGTYVVSVTDSLGCSGSGTASISEPAPLTPFAGVDDSLCINLKIDTVYGSSPPAGYSGTWSSTGASPLIFGNTTDSITSVFNVLLGSNIAIWTVSNGLCVFSDTMELTGRQGGDCEELELPTAFSPNGSGFNDAYIIHGIENYPVNEFHVFNRWGNEVYYKENYQNYYGAYPYDDADWKGQNKDGDKLPDGTYFVILVIKSSNITKSTYVDLRR